MSSIKSQDILSGKYTPENLDKLINHYSENESADETFLARYLIARKDSVPDAIEQIDRVLEWRNCFMPIMYDEVKEKLELGVIFDIGNSKTGHPIIYVVCEKVPEFLGDSNEEDMMLAAKTIIYMYDHVISKMPDNTSKFCVLLDRGTSNNSAYAAFGKKFTKLMSDVFAERVETCYVHPAGLIFYTVFNIVKWFMDPVTRDKVTPVLYRSGLQDFIDPEVLPLPLGGTNDAKFDSSKYQDSYTDEEKKNIEEKRSQAKQVNFFME